MYKYLSRRILLVLAASSMLSPLLKADSYSDGVLTIDRVLVGSDVYNQVKVTVKDLIENNGGLAQGNFDIYDGETGYITIPRVEVGNILYTNLVVSLSQAISYESFNAVTSLPSKLATLNSLVLRDCIDNQNTDVFNGLELRHLIVTPAAWGCNITEDSTQNPTYSGDSAVRFELRPGDCSPSVGGYDDCANDRNRIELFEPYPGESDLGKVVVYGHKFFLPKQDFYPSGLPITIFSQIASDNEDVWLPLIYLHTDDGKNLKIRIHKGWTYNFNDYTISNDLFDTWHDIRYELTGGLSESNSIKVFLNGELVVDVNRATFEDDSGFFGIKLGIYQAFLSRSSSIPSTVVVYHDEIYKSTSD
jgi:hypothetical protein